MLSRSAKFKQLRHFAIGVIGLAMLAGCATVPGQQAAKPASRQPLDHLAVVTPDADHDLTAQLLAGEMAIVRTDLKAATEAYGKAMGLSNDPRVAQQATELATATHDPVLAGRALERWQQLGAKPSDLATVRAQLALDRGDTEEARKQLDTLISSGDPDAWRQFGRVILGSRDTAVSARLLEALATPQRLPPDSQAWLAMSELGDKLGRHAYAQQLADAAIKRFNTAETYAWAAQLKYRNGDRAGAQAMFQKALGREPKNVGLRLAYATLLGQAGDYAGAAKVLDNGPQNADTYTLRATMAARANDSKAIARLYAQLQRAPRDPSDGNNFFLLGTLAEMLDKNEDALDWYNQVPDEDDHAFEADLRSAILLHKLGRAAESHQLLTQMQTDYLDQPAQLRRAYEADASLYMADQKFAQAEAAFSRALQVVPDDPELLYGRGLAYAETGDTDKAVADFRRLLQLKPDDIDATNALGYTLADANRDLSEAEQLIQVARSAKPNDPAIADSWGWLQYRLGHLEQAEQTLRTAWQARKDADVGVHLGEVLWKQGRQADARRVFDEVHRIDPKSSTLNDTLKRLNP
ncbi:tetratricopeptide repeat protein [Dyella sp. 2RAB6]|uniref:tetratricopeptide repeat protein n=1 Tax=Dyella sp. 2RAB6 TaxID=3232992 RepID=UPI003F922AE3